MKIKFKSRSVQKSGQSFNITIPREIVDHWNVQQGTKLEVALNDEILEVSKNAN